ncbi:MAG: transcription termination factor NusA [Candidatus Aminicenantes bacterium]|nr:transcription termination factor NusA [Candidatus Aminicenantes bacterium]
MAEELLKSITQLSKERGISPDIFYSAIEDALLTVSRKYFPPEQEDNVQVEIDRDRGRIKVYITKTVVREVSDPAFEIAWKDALKLNSRVHEGDDVKIFLPGETLGRVAAQTAKHIIMHKVMKAEQQRIYDKYHPLQGTLASGEVRRIEKGSVIVAMDMGEAILPPKELSPKDAFFRGDIIKFYIKRVFSEGKGPLILGTRYQNDFIEALVRREVPEVSEGIVEVYAISREPGIKTKIAVFSNDKTVDPVGAIVGMNGNRVLSITKELRGERIDVIAWSESPERFIASALSPADVLKVVILDEVNRKAEVTVTDDSLSAAIGKRGVNIRLASKLTHWNIQLTNRMENRSDMVQKKL